MTDRFTHSQPPEGCHTVDAHEREATAMAEQLQAKALELLAKTDRVHVATGKELALASFKYRQEAAKLALARAEHDQSAWLIAEAKKLRPQLAQRQPLRRRRVS